MRDCFVFLAACLLAAACGRGQDRVEPQPTAAVAASRFAPSMFRARVVGSGKPMILIPGLGCSGAVWDGVVERYKDRHQLHVVTLAGFGGEPAAATPSLDAVRRDLIAYIDAERMDRPVIVGHSLGGFLAYWVAATAPTKISGVVALDGVPFLGDYFREGATVATSRPGAEKMRDHLSSLPHDRFAAETRQTLSMMITAPHDVEKVAEDAVRSVPEVVGARMYELLTTDLRDEVARVAAPTLFIGSGAGANDEERRAIAARAEKQLSKIPRHRVVIAPDARHFVMLDAPSFVFSEMDAFLRANGL